jgi:hypothetical protein
MVGGDAISIHGEGQEDRKGRKKTTGARLKRVALNNRNLFGPVHSPQHLPRRLLGEVAGLVLKQGGDGGSRTLTAHALR